MGLVKRLLGYRMLAYRVFYVTAASAANYYTFLGDKEGQNLSLRFVRSESQCILKLAMYMFHFLTVIVKTRLSMTEM